MLFSRIAQCYQCPECKKKYTNEIPTSFFPILLVVGAGVVLWMRTLEAIIAPLWLLSLVSFIGSVGLFALTFSLIQFVTARAIRNGVCRDCGGSLEGVGGGIVDGAPPTCSELFLYGVMIGLPLLVGLFTVV